MSAAETEPKGESPKPRLFLSYSHSDREFAGRLAHDLRARGVEVWFDDAEMNVGDVLPHKIREAISGASFFAVILSSLALESDWVNREIDFAFESMRSEGGPKILPIRKEACIVPAKFADFLHVDFIEPGLYRRSLIVLRHAIHGKPRHKYLTAKEAARKVHAVERPSGGLYCLSQTGTTQQYISSATMQESDWVSADVKTGRSAIWIVDYYDPASRTSHSYGVFDDRVTAFPVLNLQGPDEPRIIDFNFADSDVAVPAAVARARAHGVIPNEKDFFVLSRLRYYNQTGFIWYIMFLDESFTNTTHVVSVDPLNGRVVASGPPREPSLPKKERRTMMSWSWGDPLKRLRRELQGVKSVGVDFSWAARELFADKKARGLLVGIDVEVALELVKDYEESLETITQRQILDEIERLGKLDEFERVMGSDLDPNAYLNYTIPDYEQFLRRALESAKKRI